QRTAISADVHRASSDERAQLGQIEFAALKHRSPMRRGQTCTRFAGDMSGGRRIGWTRREDDSPVAIARGQPNHQIDKRLRRPSPEGISGADMDDDDGVFWADARLGQTTVD